MFRFLWRKRKACRVSLPRTRHMLLYLSVPRIPTPHIYGCRTPNTSTSLWIKLRSGQKRGNAAAIHEITTRMDSGERITTRAHNANKAALWWHSIERRELCVMGHAIKATNRKCKRLLRTTNAGTMSASCRSRRSQTKPKSFRSHVLVWPLATPHVLHALLAARRLCRRCFGRSASCERSQRKH